MKLGRFTISAYHYENNKKIFEQFYKKKNYHKKVPYSSTSVNEVQNIVNR